MKIVNLKTGDLHEITKYVKSQSDGEESVWCNDWYGRHVIGKDCAFVKSFQLNTTQIDNLLLPGVIKLVCDSAIHNAQVASDGYCHYCKGYDYLDLQPELADNGNMRQGENQLTDEKKKLLKQGTKVEFKWHGSNSLYTGRIEVDKYGSLYFINEHCFKNDKLKVVNEGIRYYNALDSFFFFTHFEILSQPFC